MARILVVEDEADLQQVLDYNLKQAGHSVTLTKSGRDGLHLLRNFVSIAQRSRDHVAAASS